jgi:UTP--glucose-1-phosphate uridylyltransferase
MKAVVTLAGEGTRMLPATRGLRKEMLPLFYRGRQGGATLAPVVHLVVRTLQAAGVTELEMVVGRDQESVERYFTMDEAFVARHLHHPERLVETLALHHLLQTVRFRWTVQDEPKGFGDALLRTRRLVGNSPFLLHAADAILWEPEPGRLPRAMEELRRREGASVVLLVRKVAEPRNYGVIEGTPEGSIDGVRFLRVTGMEEKPERPRSHWAATAVYAFAPEIFDALAKEAKRGATELEVTAAIAQLIAEGKKVYALILTPSRGRWLSVGSPEGYLRAIRWTYARAARPPSGRPRR